MRGIAGGGKGIAGGGKGIAGGGKGIAGGGKSIAVRSTRRLAGGIQAKEEVRYDLPGRGFQ